MTELLPGRSFTIKGPDDPLTIEARLAAMAPRPGGVMVFNSFALTHPARNLARFNALKFFTAQLKSYLSSKRVIFVHRLNLKSFHYLIGSIEDKFHQVRAPPQHGQSSNKMALITSVCGTICSLRTKWP